MNVGIVGYGHVGGIMKELFPDAFIYDGPKNLGSKEAVNDCDITFVCVPTPQYKDGRCDVSIVSHVLEWLESDIIVIRSTVPVGYTKHYAVRLNKKICFQPEYYGETEAHPFADPHNRSWITLGGDTKITDVVADLYKTKFTSDLIIHQIESDEAEMAKYMENCFLAAKVTFCNQFYDLCQSANLSYNKVREAWLLDTRIGRSHTFVYPDNRGYGGHCLPKDLSSMIHQGKFHGVDVSFLESIQAYNNKFLDVGVKND